MALKVAADLPAVYADRKLVELVLRQLLGNALKYSPGLSPIHLQADVESAHVVIKVRNSGEGIPAPDQKLLFDKFYRGRQTRGRVPGTGMGLAIGREIIEAHGGRMWVETLPAKAPNSPSRFRLHVWSERMRARRRQLRHERQDFNR